MKEFHWPEFLISKNSCWLYSDLWEVLSKLVGDRGCLTFKTILKYACLSKELKVWQGQALMEPGESWSLQHFGARTGPASKQQSQAGSLTPWGREGKDWLCSYLGPQPCLPLKVSCCLRKHVKYFHERPAAWKQQERKVYSRDSLCMARWGSIWRSQSSKQLVILTRCFQRQVLCAVSKRCFIFVFLSNFWYGKYFSVRSTVIEYQRPTQIQTDVGTPQKHYGNFLRS